MTSLSRVLRVRACILYPVLEPTVSGSRWLLGPAGALFVFHSRTCGRRQRADLMHSVPNRNSNPNLVLREIQREHLRSHSL